MELLLPVRVELAVKELQALQPVQRPGLGSQGLEVRQHVRLDPLQAHLCRAQVVRFDPEGDIFALCKAVVPFLQLAFEHVAVLLPDPVVLIAPDGDVNAFGEVLHIGPLVDEGELHMDGRIKVIQEITISLKDLRLVVRLGELVVDIKKLHRLCIEPPVNPAYPVPVHLLIRNALLGRLGRLRPKPGKKAAPYGRLHTGSRTLTACAFCLGTDLPCLLHVSFQAPFLCRLLFCFWQSYLPPFC